MNSYVQLFKKMKKDLKFTLVVYETAKFVMRNRIFAVKNAIVIVKLAPDF